MQSSVPRPAPGATRGPQPEPRRGACEHLAGVRPAQGLSMAMGGVRGGGGMRQIAAHSTEGD